MKVRVDIRFILDCGRATSVEKQNTLVIGRIHSLSAAPQQQHRENIIFK
jgi:hypothetical protein